MNREILKKAAALILGLFMLTGIAACKKKDNGPATGVDSSAAASSGASSGEPSDDTEKEPARKGTSAFNFDQMNFYIAGRKYTLGKSTLQDLINGGVPFEMADLANANDTLQQYQGQMLTFKLDGDFYSAYIVTNNPGEIPKKAKDCAVIEFSIQFKPGSEKKDVLAFDFSTKLTADEAAALFGEPDTEPVYDEYETESIEFWTYLKPGVESYKAHSYELGFSDDRLYSVKMKYVP